MENFEMVYDEMNNNYSALEGMMGFVYEQIQTNPNNLQLQQTLIGLGDVAKGMLSSQMNFTDLYCKPEIKNQLMQMLSEKKDVLLNALNETNSKSL